MKDKAAYAAAVKNIESLHSNMTVLAKLSQMLKDTNTNLDDACELIQSDGPLSANVIKLSNSAYYSSNEKCRDIHSALRKVGLDEVLHVVGIAISKQVFMRDLNAYGLSAEDYWMYSYFCAVFMDTSAKRLGWEADDAYLLGLLHSIGRVVINEMLAHDEIEIFWDPTLDSELWEETMVGIRYPEVGESILQTWKFPDTICDYIKKQLNTEAIEKAPLNALLDYTHRFAELNHWNILSPDWELIDNTNHPYLKISESDELQIITDFELSLKKIGTIYKMLH